MSGDTLLELVKTLAGMAVPALAGYTLAAFKKASKSDLGDLEARVENKFRERQAYIIDPLKAQIASIEARLGDCITARELDAKFTALERRLDDLKAMIAAGRE
jgi:Tfp pilus assembly protein PilE